MSIIGIDHVQLAIPEGGEDRARSFYGYVLGLPETPKPAELAKRGGCWFESAHVKIHLGVDPGFRPGSKAHPALLVTDIQRIVERCLELSVQVVDEPMDGYRRVYIHDPFGNRLELMEKK
ncbi:MAG TPA: VOC family protein [Steroidobacteraceae bacterium]|jgi:catechol 2,3-dioxygenase-like lactoylglutathione lyase family enzyme|nr:VOC family protein [Steroidobacteraceae bacterium]